MYFEYMYLLSFQAHYFHFLKVMDTSFKSDPYKSTGICNANKNLYSTKQKFLSCFPQNVATWVMLTVLYQTSPLLSSWNVPSVFWSHHCNVHPNKAEREYNNNYNMYHVYMLTFKNCFRLTKANRAHDVDHFFKHMISKNWIHQTSFFPLYFTVPQTSFNFTNIFTSLPIKGNISLVSSGFLTSAYNFKNDFTINCQQSFFLYIMLINSYYPYYQA